MSGISKTHVHSTAGAIPVKNEKGQIAMEKVKVNRYVAGKIPDFAGGRAASSSDSESSDSDDDRKFVKPSERFGHSSADSRRREIKNEPSAVELSSKALEDRRIRRLMQSRSRDDDEDDSRHSRRRHIEEPEVIRQDSSDEEEEADSSTRRATVPRHRSPSSEDEEDLSEDEIERRRAERRLRAMEREKEEEVLGQQEESGEESEVEDEESEYDEYTDSEDETAPRLKPVFVRKKDRLTLQEAEREQQRLKEMQLEEKKLAEERKKQSVKLVEELVKQEVEMEKKKQDDDHLDLTAVNTDDENDELAYETWKIRELKRIKRDKEEKEQREREKAELDRIHSMTEEERRAYLRANPKLITNKAQKGKYKFLQKYYHRGVFYMDEESDIFKRNFAEPTLEDQFDKATLPKVMQVKDFGKAGRTKWTHLVAEDTTDFQSAWMADTQQNIKFHEKHAAGVKDVFEKPAAKKRRKL